MDKYITQLLSAIDKSLYSLNSDALVSGLALDSRKVMKGNLFFALDGDNYSAESFISNALKSEASAIACDSKNKEIIEKLLPESFPLLFIKDIQRYISEIASSFYGDASNEMNVVAITGTDGKTSVSHFVAQVFDDVAVMGTMGNGRLAALKSATHTTPDAISLQGLLHSFLDDGVKVVAMESSSHGLSQYRMDGVSVNTAVLTNLSRDHLDYHGSVENYKSAKKRLFVDLNPENIVINFDDEFGQEIYKSPNSNSNVIAYSLRKEALEEAGGNVVVATRYKAESSGYKVSVSYREQESTLDINLIGEFNISNALAVLCVLLVSGLDFISACKKISKIKPVKGRMENIKVKDFNVLVDFAHTPAALESALSAASLHAKAEVLCVFGCGGNRDKGKRALMAKAASAANKVIVTSDNPRNEAANEIANDILVGFENKDNVVIELDREKAIRYAMKQAKSGDVVLVAGKGHEEYQIIGDTKIPFSDQDVVNSFMRGAA